MNNEQNPQDIKNNKTNWLFIFNNSSYEPEIYETTTNTFKEAILDVANYFNDDSDLFKKCLQGFSDNDIMGLIELLNHFAYEHIIQVYKGESVYKEEHR